MAFSRRTLLGLPIVALAARTGAAAAQTSASPAVVIRGFYADLLAVMKASKQLSFDQRYARLAPAVTRTLNLPLMTRIAVGPGWTQLSADQQQRLSDAFTRYTVSTYTKRFDDYGGERFEVSPTPTQSPNGVIVDSQLIQSDGKPVALNYLMRQNSAGAWQVIDVYLSGTVSQLAAQRSEFVAVLQQSGADGLVRRIEEKAAALRAG